jgi:LysM repeat protein
MKIKSILITILARLVRILAKLSKFIYRVGRKVAWPIVKIFSFVGKFVFIPIYRFLYFIKHNVVNIYAPAKSKFFYLLNKTYFIHVFAVILGCFIVVNNLAAQDIRSESFGEQTVVYAIIEKEDYEALTEERGFAQQSTKILSFLDDSSTSDSTKGVLEADESDQMITDLTTTIEGGSAVIKPNIMQTIDSSELPSEQPKRDSAFAYTVRDGETVTAISSKFNVSVETILWENGLGVRSLIRKGDVLSILPVSGVSHKVVSGDTVGAIAKKYDIEKDEIVAFNGLFDEGDIKIGQRLVIPGGKKVSPYETGSKYVSRPTTQVSSVTKLFIPPSTSAAATSGMFWPANARLISQYYSWRHKGLDIAAPTGTAIYAADNGTVTLSGWTSGYGNNLVVDHGNGVKTRYAHASKLYVSVGEKVAKGQTIMAMGSTGWSTGPHLHFEVVIGGVKKNPLSYIK